MSRASAGLLLFLAVLACGREDRTQTRYTPSADRVARVVGDTAPPLRPMTGGGATWAPRPVEPESVRFPLQPVAAAGGRGAALLAAAGTETSVHVALQGGTPGQHLSGAVRQGRCAAVGSLVATLVPLSLDSTGRGEAASDVPLAPGALRARPHVVVYGPGGRPAVCGNIPARPAEP